MLREERLQFILDKLHENNKVSSPELMELLQVSEGTIRRDLNELEKRGVLQKVYGGAIPRPAAPRLFEKRVGFASDSKEQLARKAIQLIEAGQVLILDGGSTNWHIARLIPHDMEVTVFTNSIPIADVLSDNPAVTLFLLGGNVFKSSKVTYDIDVAEAVRRIRPDICFVGIRSIHPEVGITTLDYQEATIKRIMTEVSSQTVVLATQDKLDTADNFLICSCENIDVLIVEDATNKDVLTPYRNFAFTII